MAVPQLQRPRSSGPRSSVVPTLHIEQVDTDGRALRLHCQPTPHEAVASRQIRLSSATVSLEVLAASHRVRLSSGNDSCVAVETVACDSGATISAVGPALPASHRWTSGGWELWFRSSIGGPEALDTARRRVETLAGDWRALVTAFPGHPDAITALLAVEPVDWSVGWLTWHLYPGPDPHVVATTTLARRRTDKEARS